MNDTQFVKDTKAPELDCLPPEAPLAMPPQVLAPRSSSRLAMLMRLVFGWQSA
ncbi:hypothetical protein [Tropicimonas sediminicola]|uniref:Uncharacterized protein n=1 Tax=Tropicimonas sediminicola TaxID=1031541 RepID=A0A239F2L5_9RHOB|nr:hypothetical protein [Tropicimonas sediminicola]SNS50788.1 hypothetical protein SAMN05421757_102449 [Tropicimonas sediminicola]